MLFCHRCHSWSTAGHGDSVAGFLRYTSTDPPGTQMRFGAGKEESPPICYSQLPRARATSTRASPSPGSSLDTHNQTPPRGTRKLYRRVLLHTQHPNLPPNLPALLRHALRAPSRLLPAEPRTSMGTTPAGQISKHFCSQLSGCWPPMLLAPNSSASWCPFQGLVLTVISFPHALGSSWPGA